MPCPQRATHAVAGSPASARPVRPLTALAAAAACVGALALPSASARAATSGGAAAQNSTPSQEASTTASTSAPVSTTSTTAGTSQTGGASAGGTTTGSQRTTKTLATWFGPGFYGNKTACGQTLTPALVGVASRTLACGTLVRIGYRGHSLTVPVLDRGPYGHNGASWDLTAGAARALGILETVRITTAIVGSVPNGPLLGVPLQAGTPDTSTTGGETAPSVTASTTPTAGAAATGGATAS